MERDKHPDENKVCNVRSKDGWFQAWLQVKIIIFDITIVQAAVKQFKNQPAGSHPPYQLEHPCLKDSKGKVF